MRECCEFCYWQDECGRNREMSCSVRKLYDEDPAEWRSRHNDMQEDNIINISLGE